MRKLGVLVLSDPSKGGTFQYTLSMVEGLRHVKGWEITLYTTSDNAGYNNMGFPVRFVDANLDRRIPSLLRALVGGVKIEPFKNEDLVLAPIYSPVLLHTKKTFSYTLHDIQELYYPQFFTVAQRWWRWLIHSMLTKKAGRIICESHFVKADIERSFRISSDKIDVIVAPPLPVQGVNEQASSAPDIRKKYGLSGRYLFYPAQFWVHKNHMRLVEAFSRVVSDYPDCEMVLTGKKRDEFEKVTRRIVELGLEEHVKHIGYVEQQDLQELYREATALVMPSLFESVSIPVFEAFQYGTPVAVSDVVALPEQIGDAGLLFDPLSVESIETAIRSLLEDPDLRKYLSKAGRQRFASLTFDKNGRELEKMLERLCNQRQNFGIAKAVMG